MRKKWEKYEIHLWRITNYVKWNRKALDVMKKNVEVTNEFLMQEDIKTLYQKFLVEKARIKWIKMN